MSVTTTQYTQGGNSKLVTIVGEIGSTNILSTINSTIIGLGWSQYDVVGTTLFSPVVTYVYRAPNYDGVTYKYLIIRWDTIQLKYYVSTCESWDAVTTHRPTNESWSAAGGYAQGYDPQNCYFIISATARHFMIWNFINGQAGLWQAIVEFERVAPEDLASVNTTPYPCWAYTNSLMIGTPHHNNSFSYSNTCFAFPRLPNGYVGYQAANYMTPMTNRGQFPPQQFPIAQTISGDTNYGHLGSYYKNLSYGWDTTGLKIPVSPMSVNSIGSIMPFGRAFNFGVLRPIGALGDTIYANVDSTGGWLSSNANSSVNTECFLLPCNGGQETTQYTSPLGLCYTSGNLQYTVNNTPPGAIGKSIAIGDNVWVACSAGLYTYSISGQTFTVRNNQYVVTDIVFDGVRTIYAATASGILKTDTQTYANLGLATSTTTTTYGCRYLGIDNKNVYASTRGSLNSPNAVTLDQATFTISTGNVMTANTSSTVATAYGTPVPDYQGNVYLSTQPGTSSTVILYTHRFNANTGAINAYTPGNPITGTTSTTFSGASFYYDFITSRLFYVIGYVAAQAVYAGEAWAGNLTTISQNNYNLPATPTQASNAVDASGSNTLLGDMSITPFRGGFLINTKYLSGPVANYSALFSFIPSTTSIPTPLATSINIVNTTGLKSSLSGCSGGLWTDGCRIFGYTGGSFTGFYVITNLYNATTNQGSQVGRLTLRG